MGITTPDLPETPVEEILAMPFKERNRLLMTHWVDHGFGGPKQMHLLYILKLVVYIGGGFLIGRYTPGFAAGTDWYLEPIFFQKLLVWTVFFEIIGLGSSSGPLAFKFKPMIGGFLYLGRTRTLRLAPWPDKIPFTGGDERTRWDVAVYWLLIADLVYLMAVPGTPVDRIAGSGVGLLPTWAVLTAVALILIGGLRDKLMYLMSRSEQYLIPMLFFTVLSTTDLVVALKLFIVLIWCCAAISKPGHHFTHVIAPMVSNTPWITSKRFKRSMYRDFPNDLRPSRVAWFFAHILGTLAEFAMPLVLLFSPWRSLTLVAVISMLAFHLFIISTFPLAVPLEWNVFFMFWTVWAFWSHPAADGWAITDLSGGVLLAVLVLGLTLPIIGNLRPQWVSFLPSMRQYAGNWASAVWAFRDHESEKKLDRHIVKPAENQLEQLIDSGFPEPLAEMFLCKAQAWRSLHTQGVGIMSVMERHVDIDEVVFREAEFVCNSLTGWNFGDGHLHDERLLEAVQRRCDFEPGELTVVWVESKPIHEQHLEYRVIDAALGIVERGRWHVEDTHRAMPWLPDGSIPHDVTWQADGFRAAFDTAHGPGRRGNPEAGAGAAGLAGDTGPDPDATDPRPAIA